MHKFSNTRSLYRRVGSGVDFTHERCQNRDIDLLSRMKSVFATTRITGRGDTD